MKALAIVIGVGDGSTSRSMAGRYGDVVTIVLPGEEPQNVPGKQFVVGSTEDAAEVISKRLSKHEDSVRLPDTDFYDSHPCYGDESFRQAFCVTFYSQLGERPLWMGDSVTDCLQGAYHIAMTAQHLIGAPRPDEIRPIDCPALCIASGPSLAPYIDRIRSLQDKCLIVCADSVLEPLLAAGITPHVVTPLERTPEITTESFPRDSYPGVIFGGTPVVHEEIAPKFGKHILIPGSDLLFKWAGCEPDRQFFYGQSTATLALALCLRLTTGKVYLVGHDLSYADGASHWGAVNPAIHTRAGEGDVDVPANAGGTLKSRAWWNIFRRELSDMARAFPGRVSNVNAATGVGAVIYGTTSEDIPDADSLTSAPKLELPDPKPERLDAFLAKLSRIPRDARRMLAKLSSSHLRLADLNLNELVPGPNRDLFAYLLRSIIASTSMEHWSGRPNAQAAEFGAQAIRNTLREHMDIYESMAEQAALCNA